MVIVKQSLDKCEVCAKMRGHIVEKYNGLVPVYCKCDLHDKEKKLANPCAIFCEGGTLGPRVIWKPISDSREADGRWMHTPWFAGPSTW